MNFSIKFNTVILASSTVIFTACTGVAQKEGTINKTINPTEFEQKLKQSEIQLIDVRTPEEYADGGITGSVNLNYNSADFEQRIGQLDKNKTVLVYCLSGGRSGKAANQMNSMGFKEVYNMQGGLVQWRSEGKTAGKVSGGMTMEQSHSTQKSGLNDSHSTIQRSGRNDDGTRLNQLVSQTSLNLDQIGWCPKQA